METLRSWKRKRGHTSPCTILPPPRLLAGELCAQRGFYVETHRILPSGGTILSVDDLNFDRALVLLSILENARVYSDRVFSAPANQLRALSLRVAAELSTPMLESVVSDLSHERVVVISRRQCEEIRSRRLLLAPVQRVRVELDEPERVQVLVEN